jgi:hypothetical protein
MRSLKRGTIWIAGVALGLGVMAGPARAEDGYYLEDGCRPVRVYERVRVYEPVPYYEPVRVYSVDPYYDLLPYPIYGYVPRYDHFYRDAYYRRERGFSFDINIHLGGGARYRGPYGRIGHHYRSRRYWD